MENQIKLIKIKVESMKKIPVKVPHHSPYLSGYNEAIEDILAFLEVLEVANKNK